MKRFATLSAAAALAVLLAAVLPAWAQMGPNVPRIFGSFEPKPGAWSEYTVTDKDSGTEVRMRMAIVGKEGDSFWYEVRNEVEGSVNIVKMLVDGDPNETSENIRRMIIKSGDSPAMEMNRDFVVMGRQVATQMFEKRSGVESGKGSGASVEEVGKREVTVPAGTFKTIQYRITAADGTEMGTYDVADNVPPFGLVVSETGSSSMTLTGYGGDAVSAVTEEPVPMNMPPGMPQGMPQGMPPGMGSPPGR